MGGHLDRAGGQEPERSVTTSLSEAAKQAMAAALARFAAGRLTPEAELQLAIYPWDYGEMAPMYDIAAEAGQYRAHNIVADSPDIAAPTLEELVDQMAVQPRGREAMLRWVRQSRICLRRRSNNSHAGERPSAR